MSGPKVVRIVTREELIALCERQLAGLDARIEAWTKIGRRNDVITEVEVEELAGRRKWFQTLLEDASVEVLQKQVASEISFLEQDMADRLEKAAAQAREAKAAKRRRGDAARQAMALLDTAGPETPIEIRNGLQAAIDNDIDDSALNAAIARVLEHVATAGDGGPVASEQQKQLAAQLSDGTSVKTVAVWRASVDGQTDTRLERIEQHLSELELWASESIIAEFAERLDSLTAISSENRLSVQIDSLMADLSVATAKARETFVQLQDLAACKNELETIDGSEDCRALAARIGRAITTNDSTDTSAFIAEASALMANEISKADAAFRRQAVLEGLSRLGYEVREGMQTEFANGPIVVNNPATPGYGVEIGGPASAEHLQMRVVSYGESAGADTSRDRDIETRWCGDIEQFGAFLAEAGVTLAIERATEAGAVPVKLVDAPALHTIADDVGVTPLAGVREFPKS